MRVQSRWWQTVWLLGILGVGNGCGDDRVLLPEAASGTIEGYLTDGEPLPNENTAVYIQSVGNAAQQFETRIQVGADGHYVATVPSGPVIISFRHRYRDRIYHGRDGMTFAQSECETVQVAGGVQRVDFACGRVTLDVGLPEEVENLNLRCGLVPVGEVSDYDSSTGQLLERRRYEFRLVPPGDYYGSFSHSTYGKFYVPATYVRDEAEVLTVVAGENATSTSDLPGVGIVSGTVTGSSQVFGHAVEVYAWNGDDWLVGTQAADDGTFVLRFLAGAEFRLAIRSDEIWGFLGGSDLDSATEFILAPGWPDRGPLARGVGTGGRDRRLAGPNVLSPCYPLRRSGPESPSGTGRGGPCRFVDRHRPPVFHIAPRGSYLSITPEWDATDWLPQFYDRREALAEADPILVPPAGQIGSVAVTVVTGGRIRGRLHGQDGSPPDISTFRLDVHAADNPLVPLRVLDYWDVNYSLATGDYRLNRLLDGDYKLHLLLNGYWIWWPAADTWDDATAIAIVDNCTVEGVD